VRHGRDEKAARDKPLPKYGVQLGSDDTEDDHNKIDDQPAEFMPHWI
jgi:hypothetical protein